MVDVGIDIGSRTVKLVAIENDKLIVSHKDDSSYDPMAVCRRLLEGLDYTTLTATGYGRMMFSRHFNCKVISEIKAFAVGAHAKFPESSAVLDIGGQDTKAICLDSSGRIIKFEMNDRCAAGTGRFLEIIAAALQYRISEFGEAALTAQKAEKISSMCTVFAESEVISLITGGAQREEIALGIHEAIIQRTLGMLGRLPELSPLVFAGGVALNQCIRQLLCTYRDIELLVPSDPQIIGAFGAAICGSGERGAVRSVESSI
jgi:predicted CoA-substrate-specific enzyme activase